MFKVLLLLVQNIQDKPKRKYQGRPQLSNHCKTKRTNLEQCILSTHHEFDLFVIMFCVWFITSIQNKILFFVSKCKSCNGSPNWLSFSILMLDEDKTGQTNCSQSLCGSLLHWIQYISLWKHLSVNTKKVKWLMRFSVLSCYWDWPTRDAQSLYHFEIF